MTDTLVPITEADAANCVWELSEVTPDYRRYIGKGTHPVTGLPIVVQKTEFLAEKQLLEANAAERNATDGRRWTQGSGSDRNGVPLVKVASIPLNKYYAECVPYIRDGDTDHLKWWLERETNQPFRTRRGNL